MRLPLNQRKLAFIDVETTGLYARSHEIIEVAIIVTNPDFSIVCEWSTKVKPAFPEWANRKALEINGYSEEEWKEAPLFLEVAAKIRELLRWNICVAHNSPFDKAFLMKHLRQHSSDEDMKGIGYHWIDTVTTSYLAFPESNSLSLASICDNLGISNDGQHRALVDARRCREVFMRSVECLRGKSPRSTYLE